MRHYFIDRERGESEFFKFSEEFLGNTLTFNSCNDVFSKNEIDLGSKVLIETFLKSVPQNLSASVLDLGCGYGAIGVNLKKHLPNINLTMSDVVETAVELAKRNLLENGVSAEVVLSNLFENVGNNFQFIVSNPPIKTGKALLFQFAENSINHLALGGQMFLVIRKNLGMESLKNKLTEVFGNCEVIKKHKGFYILKCVKGGN